MNFDPVAQRKRHLAQLGLSAPSKKTIRDILNASPRLQGFEPKKPFGGVLRQLQHHQQKQP